MKEAACDKRDPIVQTEFILPIFQPLFECA
jgi:hypothetical protein